MIHADSSVNCERTYEGGCSNWNSRTLNLNFNDHEYTIEDCHNLCLQNAKCGGFFVGTGTKHCLLVKAGCRDDDNPLWDYYAMTDCSKTGLCHILRFWKIIMLIWKCKSTFLWLRKNSFLIATHVIENRSCPREDGFCIKQDGRDQNSRVKKLNSFDGKAIERQEQCVELCKRENEATGCEVIWGQGNRGCYVHKAEIARGNGGDRHYCWVFSRCKDEDVSNMQRGSFYVLIYWAFTKWLLY